jgi:hypothetical protein
MTPHWLTTTAAVRNIILQNPTGSALQEKSSKACHPEEDERPPKDRAPTMQ